MQESNKIAISNARQFADITTLLAAAKSADEARAIFRERYPSDSEQAMTPPEGEPGEPEFWLELIEVAKELESRVLHLDFDCQFVLSSAAEAEGREVLYTGRLRDGSQGVIYIPHVLDVYDDPELAIIVENNRDGKFFDNTGRDPHDEQVEIVELIDENDDPIRLGLSARVDLGLDAEREEAVAVTMRRIESELIGREVGAIRSDLLLCAIQDRDYFGDAVLPISDAIKKFKTEKIDDWFSLAAVIDDEKVLVLSDPYFAAWLLENLEND